MHDSRRYDATMASLEVLGMKSKVVDLGNDYWSTALRNVRMSLEFAADLACHEFGYTTDKNWHQHYTKNMLDDSLEELYAELREASERVDMGGCDRLVLIGVDDASWFLHAFLRHMSDTFGVRPDATLVALGSRSNSPLAQAVAACMPEQVPGVRYLSIRGSVPIRKQRDDDSYADTNNRQFDDMLAQTRMTCLAGIDGAEECIVGSAGYDGATHSFLADPTTVAQWIAKLSVGEVGARSNW
jgi:hypothetical protein